MSGIAFIKYQSQIARSGEHLPLLPEVSGCPFTVTISGTAGLQNVLHRRLRSVQTGISA